MEFLTILLSSLITLVSPTGIVLDRVAQTALRQQFQAVEQLQVRIDNAPSYQIIQGKAERIRIAGRGLFPVQGVRLEALELETDPIHLNPRSLQRGKPRLVEPLRAGIRLVMTEADLNRALRSPAITKQLRALGVSVLNQQDADQANRYELLNPRVEFLPDRRIRFQMGLREAGDPAILEILAESGLEVVAGRQLHLVQPMLRVNGEAVPAQVLSSLVDGIAEQSDLRQFERSGILARVLQWQMDPKQLQLALFVQVAPGKKL